MATQARPWGATSTTGTNTGWRVLAGAVFGLIGSIPMAMIAMMVMGIQSGDFWAPPKAIAATFLGESAMQPGFVMGPILIGMMFHLFNGAWLGALFGLITPKLTLTWSALAGVMFGIVVALGAVWVVLPIVDPVLAQSATDRLGMFWWLVVHMMFGLVTGLYPLARNWGWFGAR